MTRIGLLSMTAIAPAISGCVPMMAMSAVNMAAQSAQGPVIGNEALKPEARAACSEHAAQYGAVHVIDVQQASVSQIIVWGTVDDGKEKRSFQCNFGTKITGFRLRPITPLR